MRRIACPSAALCVAPDSTGALVSRDPTAGATAWHEVPFSLGTTEPASVSCTAGGFCAVGGGHGLAISADPADPTSWRVLSVPGDWPISSVSCPSAALCLVGRYDGSVLATTDPTDPSPAFTPVYSPVNGYDAAPIWCSPSTGCVASAEGGEVVRSSDPARPGSWSLTHVDSAAERIEAYACPPVGACIAVDSAGGALTPTDGESWPRTTIDLPPPCSAPACENEAVYLRDATGVHEVDSVSAGSETDLSGLRLSDATLTWTHQGTTRSVPVR
jgi:hypothetical protein